MSFIGPTGKNPSRYFWTIQMLVAAVYKTAQTSASIDRYRNGGYASLTLELCPGLWTDGTHAFTINESDDNSTFTAVVGGGPVAYPQGGGYFTGSSFLPLKPASTVVQRLHFIGGQHPID